MSHLTVNDAMLNYYKNTTFAFFLAKSQDSKHVVFTVLRKKILKSFLKSY